MLWANASSFVLLFRSVFGDTFQVGFLYNIAGYDVFLGEVIISILMKATFGIIMTFAKKLANFLRTFFAVLLMLSVVIIFIGVVKNSDFSFMFTPAFTDKEPIWVQILNVAVYAPFMFVGFETVTHSVGELKFPVKKIFGYSAIAIFCGMLVYIILALTATSGTPEGYNNWQDYMQDLPNLSGIATIPVFYNSWKYLGDAGIWLIGIAAFSALATGVMGFHRAGARVLAIMATEGLLSKKLARVNKHGVPVRANITLLLVSVPVFFVGRTAIGWNADVSTFAAAIVYAYISICTFKSAPKNLNPFVRKSGIAGLISMIVIVCFLLIPNVFAKNVLSRESYILLTVWSLLGMIYYWFVFWKDKNHRFGKSTVMWLVMVGILFFSTAMWSQANLIEELIKNYNLERLPSILVWDNIIQFFSCFIAIIFLFSLFTIMMNRERELNLKYESSEQSKNKIISENELLTEFTVKLQSQNLEIERQRANIEHQKNEIQSSINYAYNIQQALLTPETIVNKVFPDNFLLYLPRDVVSGDFYWVEQFGDYKVCIVADCTGHGVPGGFMSMLGITNLNYIVGRVLEPNEILNKLREAIIKSLRQKTKESDEQSTSNISRNCDGLDAAVYVINEKEMTLKYAGANNPLLLIRGNDVQLFKADKMPVGIFIRTDPFKNVEIKLQKGDCLYTFSDGYQDQLNWDTKKKFFSKSLRDLLFNIHDKPMEEQKQILIKTFEDWRGPKDFQVDDILIFGVRI